MFIGENTISSVSPNYTVEANEAYAGGVGCQMMMIESYQNDMAFLGGLIASDVKERALVTEGAGEEQIESYMEGVLSSAWEKIKEWVKKVWEKIKGIFKAFIARLEDFMGKNGYAFYEKYKTIIHNGTPLKDVNAKYAKPTGKLEGMIEGGKIPNVNFLDSGVKNEDDDADSDELTENMLKLMNPALNDAKTIRKDFKDECFETEASEELEDSKIGEYVRYIQDKKSITEKVKKLQDNNDKLMKKVLQNIDKAAQNSAKKIADDKGGEGSVGVGLGIAKDGKDGRRQYSSNTKHSQKEITYAQRRANALSRALTLYNGAAMECAKFAVSQSRRLAAVIVAYKSRHKNEGVEMSQVDYDAVAEVCDYKSAEVLG